MKSPTAVAVAHERAVQLCGKRCNQKNLSGVQQRELVRLTKGWVSLISRDIRPRLRVSQRGRRERRALFAPRLEALSTLLQFVDLGEAVKRA